MQKKAKAFKVRKDIALRCGLEFSGKIIGCRQTNSYFYVTPAEISMLTSHERDHEFFNYLRRGFCIVDALNMMKAGGVPMNLIVEQCRSFLIRRNLFRCLTEIE